jgi:hypothetical protein
MVKKIVFSVFFFIVGYLFFDEFYYAFSISVTSYFVYMLLFSSTGIFAFREFALFLYALNYLLSPTITYHIDRSLLEYPMKIAAENYFSVAIPGYICLVLGMYAFNTRIFKPRIDKMKKDSAANLSLLKFFTWFGFILRFMMSFFPGELAFFLLILSSLRFIGSFAIFMIDPKTYWWYPAFILVVEIYFAAIGGLYHDAIMWILFFSMFFVYVTKPTVRMRLVSAAVLIFAIVFIQNLKGSYRKKTWTEGSESSLSLVLETSNEISDETLSDKNLLSILSRSNQAWILASTIDRMDRVGDFQQLYILGLYVETSILPRILAPNKLKSGEKKIFNTFSGHRINANTSMGLGIFADGYIALGFLGVVLFTFGLGLFFNLTFLIVESWMKLSEFYVLMLLPLLNYAVRPDCETQATINHIVKGLIVFSVIVTLTKFNFVFRGDNRSRLKRKLITSSNIY